MGGRTTLGWLALSVALTAAPGLAGDRPVLIIPGFTGTNTLLQHRAEALERAVRAELERTGAAEVRAGAWVLGAVRNVALQDCGFEADAACPAEPDEAWLLAGRVRGGSKAREVELRLVRLADRVVVWRDGAPVDPASPPPEVFTSVLLRAAEEAGFRLGGQPDGTAALLTGEAPPPEATPPSPRAPAWATVAVGAAGLVTGGAFFLDGLTPWNNLHSATWRARSTSTMVDNETERFNTDTTVGIVALSVGGLVLAGGLVWALTAGGGDAPAVAVAPTLGGVVVGGRW